MIWYSSSMPMVSDGAFMGAPGLGGEGGAIVSGRPGVGYRFRTAAIPAPRPPPPARPPPAGRGPRGKRNPPPPRGGPPWTPEAGCVRARRDAPQARPARLIFGDWLADQADARLAHRGELLRLQGELADW